MALNPHYKATTRNAMLDAITAAIGASGFLRIYDGTQPATPDTALGSQVRLSNHALSASAFAAAVAGVATANAIANDTGAVAGTATWFSLVTSAGTRIVDGSVGTSGADLNLNSVTFTTGATISISALTLTLPA